MIILARVKENKETCGYIVEHNNKNYYVNKELMQKLEPDNAIHLKNGEFCGKQLIVIESISKHIIDKILEHQLIEANNLDWCNKEFKVAITLTDAIQHLDELLESDKEWSCEECKQEHIQLRKWLVELSKRRMEEVLMKSIRNDMLHIKLCNKINKLKKYIKNKYKASKKNKRTSKKM